MIKIFRIIRQNLLSEGKTKEYFKYAIGEILLVVIGILIALQINNWNTELGNHKKEKLYLNNLKVDLTNQIDEIDNQIESEKRFMSHAKKILRAYNEETIFTFDTTLLEAANGLQDRRTFKTENPTYSELLNTGDMKLIRDTDLKRHLVTYYQDIERTKEVIKLNNSYFVDSETAPKLRKLIPSYWADPEEYYDEIWEEVRYDGGISRQKMNSLIELAQRKLKDNSMLMEFMNMAITRYDYAWFHVQIMLSKRQETQEVLDKLNSLIKEENYD